MSSFALDQVTVASPAQFVASLVKSTPMPLHDTVVLAYLHNDGCQHIDTFALDSDWVEIVEAVQNTLRVNSYEQVIICVHTDRTEDALPFTAQVKDLSAVIGSDVHVLDELLIDGNRYWSYMCDGCCDPEGNVFSAEAPVSTEVTIDFTKTVVSQGTTVKSGFTPVLIPLVNENTRVALEAVNPQLVGWAGSFAHQALLGCIVLNLATVTLLVARKIYLPAVDLLALLALTARSDLKAMRQPLGLKAEVSP